ncbi:hypothetical protein QZM93_30930 [Burkholderia cepacia]|uniref:hypothetical protein n=1 Tax=Burkholderia cepacia TaxID=292 RepID=UPI0011AC193F|nr:hypothetical protein [Burkholderia cepacia]MDN7893024.1 hypothetical protein [Burkholderia cepacia]
MPADKLGRDMKSSEFLVRANAAVAKAVRELDAKGIQHAYLDRKAGRIVGRSDDASDANDSCEGRRATDILNSEDPTRGARK